MQGRGAFLAARRGGLDLRFAAGAGGGGGGVGGAVGDAAKRTAVSANSKTPHNEMHMRG